MKEAKFKEVLKKVLLESLYEDKRRKPAPAYEDLTESFADEAFSEMQKENPEKLERLMKMKREVLLATLRRGIRGKSMSE